MKFSEFVVPASKGLLMDPLGLMSPYAALQDRLFRQFTVLTNLPGYHSALAYFYEVIAGSNSRTEEFALAFRRLEVLWGLLHAAHQDGASILNITKYRDLLAERDELSLRAIPASSASFQRLAYGTLGHYSNPSVAWGLLDKSARQLAATGKRLAKGFSERADGAFAALLQTWASGGTVPRSALDDLAPACVVSAPPTRGEAKAWRDLIADYCAAQPQVACLWDAPMPETELKKWYVTHETYAGLFPELKLRYAPLASELSQVETFEKLAALVQFVFEQEYADRSGELETDAGYDRDALARGLGQLAASYAGQPQAQDSKGLFQSLSGVGGYREAARIISAHHQSHQRSKGSQVFYTDDAIVVRDKVGMDRHDALQQRLARASADESVAILAHNYRRDWHFERAARYHGFANPA